MNYRVNYANGQVSQTFATRREANVHFADISRENRHAFVQVYILGSADHYLMGWYRAHNSTKELC